MRTIIWRMSYRTLAGMALLYPAYEMHQEAHRLSDKAAGVKPRVTLEQQIERDSRPKLTDEELRAARRADPSRKGQAANFFGSDERDAEIERAAPPLMKRAIETERDAFALAAGGLAIIGWGLWAVIGPFVRAVQPEPKREEPNPSSFS